MEQKYIVAIEIGSSRVKGAVGTIESSGTLVVNAIEELPLIDCVRYGCIQNVEEVRACVAEIITSLEARANISPRKVKGVYVSLGGRSMMSYRRDIEQNFDDETEITNDVITNLIDGARVESFTDKEIVEIMPMGFTVDNMVHLNPIGTFGHNLKASLNVIACRPQIIKNIDRVIVEKLQLGINGYIVRQTALAQLVLTKEETQLGCVLVDFGAETTTMSIHKSGVMQHMVTIPMGSRNITRDLTSLSITEETAENIKKEKANANIQETSGNGGKSTIIEGVEDVEINNYVQYRASEIVANIIGQIEQAGFKIADLSCGIIIVGGGSKLKGFNALLNTQSSLKVRSGMVSGMVHIAENSVASNDALDVIAVLFAASKGNGEDLVNCLEGDALIEIGNEEDVEVINTKNENVDINRPKATVGEEEITSSGKGKTSTSGTNITKKLFSKLAELLKEDGYDD